MGYETTITPARVCDTRSGYGAAVLDEVVTIPVGWVPCADGGELGVEVEQCRDQEGADPARVAVLNELGQSRSLAPCAARDLAARLVSAAEVAERHMR